MSVVSRFGSSLAECLDSLHPGLPSLSSIHPSNSDWVLRHWNRSCENQENLASEHTRKNSGLHADMEDYSSTCSEPDIRCAGCAICFSCRTCGEEKENELLSHARTA